MGAGLSLGEVRVQAGRAEGAGLSLREVRVQG